MPRTTPSVRVLGPTDALARTHLDRIVDLLHAAADRVGTDAELRILPNGHDALLTVSLGHRDVYGPAAPELVRAFLRGLQFGARATGH